MRHVVRLVICIPLAVIAFGLVYLGLMMGALAALGLIIFVFFVTMDREKRTRSKEKACQTFGNMGQGVRDFIDVANAPIQETVKTAGKVAVKIGEAAANFTESAYKEMGGREGAQKAIRNMGKGAAELGKLGTTAFIAATDAISEIAKDAGRQIEARRREKEDQRRMEELENVFVKFIRNDDDGV